MKLSLLLPWFPIILSVGVGARLMNRARALSFGVCCALFWIVLVQAGGGWAVWSDVWTVVALVAGSAAIVGMAAWAGEEREVMAHAARRPDTVPLHATVRPGEREAEWDGASGRGALASSGVTECAAEAMAAFDDWLERHRSDADPWPVFDEFVRSVLYQTCHAAHVRLYRVLSEGDGLVPLAEVDRRSDTTANGVDSARRGIVGHVVTTGYAYVAGDATQGDLVQRLAAQSERPVDWCFAIQQGGRKLGVVVVGQLGHSPGEALAAGRPLNRGALDVAAGLVQLFWTTLSEVCRARAADRNDPVTGVLSREAFLVDADVAATTSYHEHEPVAVAAVTIEGLRRLDDAGKWDVANELVRGIAQLIRQKVRADDRVGRFDDARFLILLRRVDSELAGLIVEQIMVRLVTYCQNSRHMGANVAVRCGLAGSGTESPPVTALIARALTRGHDARAHTVTVATDVRESGQEGQTTGALHTVKQA